MTRREFLRDDAAVAGEETHRLEGTNRRTPSSWHAGRVRISSELNNDYSEEKTV